eukprot:gnl/TRDRNA2_/TRDRNA2_169534_c0_seq1.p1 gnl/TRDRNA2_/TRDRNA2_169534_c0~~gnl/TRDRNA2_/TRDRNA2_169534_c0_seq1.p1  ORF type:complete len:180 (-),score=38.32 gnl/TRDRNA2_/TRDRNA2_169534_c0_seq1:67-606(-)
MLLISVCMLLAAAAFAEHDDCSHGICEVGDEMSLLQVQAMQKNPAPSQSEDKQSNITSADDKLAADASSAIGERLQEQRDEQNPECTCIPMDTKGGPGTVGVTVRFGHETDYVARIDKICSLYNKVGPVRRLLKNKGCVKLTKILKMLKVPDNFQCVCQGQTYGTNITAAPAGGDDSDN